MSLREHDTPAGEQASSAGSASGAGPLGRFKASLVRSSEDAREWFESAAVQLQRSAYDVRSAKGTAPKCAVYVYYGGDGSALYAGQTSRSVKARKHDPTSPHAKKPWWGQWTTMRYLPLADETERLVLEMSLILAYAPPFNGKPAGRAAAALFAS